jgi:glycerol-3-phosphate O-acyltransferase
VIENKKRHHEIDEEDIEKVKEDLAKVSKVASEVMELTGQLVEIFKNRAYDVVKVNAQTFFAN